MGDLTMPEIGIVLHPAAVPNQVDDLVLRAREAAAAGITALWLPQAYGLDALTTLAVIGRDVPDVSLGASVLPVQPRHPLVLAGHARTVQAATRGRLILGLGVSHPGLIEPYGFAFEAPVARLREHLEVLRPTLRDEPVEYAGRFVATSTTGVAIEVLGATPEVPVILGALGPRMLRLAGELADGTMTFLAGPRTVADHVVPRIRQAAADAGRPDPQVVMGLPVAITARPAELRDEVSRSLAGYAELPSYRGVLEREGIDGAGELAILGSESEVEDGLRGLAAYGVSGLSLTVVGTVEERRRTLEFLGRLAAARRMAPWPEKTPDGRR